LGKRRVEVNWETDVKKEKKDNGEIKEAKSDKDCAS
jgi:hypothetical protein